MILRRISIKASYQNQFHPYHREQHASGPGVFRYKDRRSFGRKDTGNFSKFEEIPP